MAWSVIGMKKHCPLLEWKQIITDNQRGWVAVKCPKPTENKKEPRVYVEKELPILGEG